MVILLVILLVLLVLLAATRPIHPKYSDFELNRQKKTGELPSFDLRRVKFYGDVVTLLRVMSATILTLLVPVAITVFGWVIGIIVSVVVALEYQAIARLKPVVSLASRLYRYYEKYLLIFCEKAGWLFKWFRVADSAPHSVSKTELFSKEELLDVVKRSPRALTKSELRIVTGALGFSEKMVQDIMTPKSMIDSIKADELLGPITLSELHATGHSRFPVIDGDIDHVVGVLYVRDLLIIDGTRASQKVSEVMDRRVCFIRQDQTLDQALAAFIETEKLLFVVINEFRETVGLLSLEDVLETLLGQKINDEFEKHTDLRAVAERNPRKNNTTSRTRQNV